MVIFEFWCMGPTWNAIETNALILRFRSGKMPSNQNTPVCLMLLNIIFTKLPLQLNSAIVDLCCVKRGTIRAFLHILRKLNFWSKKTSKNVWPRFVECASKSLPYLDGGTFFTNQLFLNGQSNSSTYHTRGGMHATIFLCIHCHHK